MKEVYLWTIEYKVNDTIIESIKVITRTATYSEAEIKAVKAIKLKLQDRLSDVFYITNIKPCELVYADLLKEETTEDTINRLLAMSLYNE